MNSIPFNEYENEYNQPLVWGMQRRHLVTLRGKEKDITDYKCVKP